MSETAGGAFTASTEAVTALSDHAAGAPCKILKDGLHRLARFTAADTASCT